MKQEVITFDAIQDGAGQRPRGMEDSVLPEINVTATALLPTRFGRFDMTSFRSTAVGEPHIALSIGLVDKENKTPLVRMHSECLTGDVFGSIKCECGDQLELAMQEIASHGCGVLIYLRQEGRGIGIENKIKAYALQDQGYDTIQSNELLGLPVDGRTYGDAAAILHYLDVTAIELLTNNPKKLQALQDSGIEVLTRRKIQVETCDECASYMAVKRDKMGHMLD